MKLHLPKLLRAALLATFAVVATGTTVIAEETPQIINIGTGTTTYTVDSLTLSGSDILGYITDSNTLYTAFNNNTRTKNLTVNGDLTLEGSAQVAVGGGNADAGSAAYLKVANGTLTVKGNAHLKALGCQIKDLVIEGGKVELDTQSTSYCGSGNSSYNVSSNKQASISNSLTINGGSLFMGAYNGAYVTKGLTSYHCSAGFKGTINQTGGLMSVRCDAATNGAVTINQTGTAQSSMYFTDQLEVGTSLTFNQSNNNAKLEIGRLTGSSTFSAKTVNISQSGSGYVHLVNGTHFGKLSTVNIEQTGSGNIDIGGSFSTASLKEADRQNSFDSSRKGFTNQNTNYNINQTGSGTLSLLSGVKLTAVKSTIKGKLSIASNASLLTQELVLAGTSNLANSGTLTVGKESAATPSSSVIDVTEDGVLTLENGYGASEQTGAIKEVRMSGGKLNYSGEVALSNVSINGGSLCIKDGSDKLTPAQLNVTAGGIHMTVDSQASATAAPITLSSATSWTMSNGTTFTLKFTSSFVANANIQTNANTDTYTVNFKEQVASGTSADTLTGLKNGWAMESMGERWTLSSSTWVQDGNITYVSGTLTYNPWIVVDDDGTISDNINDTSAGLPTGQKIVDAEVTLSGDNEYSLGTQITNSKVTLKSATALGSGEVMTSGTSELTADANTQVNLPGTITNGSDGSTSHLTLKGDFAASAASLGTPTEQQETHIDTKGNSGKSGFLRDEYTEYTVVNNTGSATLDADKATVTIDGEEYLLNSDGKTYILPDYKTYFIDATDTDHATSVSNIQTASGNTTELVDMDTGTLTVDGDIKLDVSGGKLVTQSDYAVEGSVANATISATDNTVINADVKDSTLEGQVTLSGEGKTEGQLSLNDATLNLGKASALQDVTSLKTSGTTGIGPVPATTLSENENTEPEKITLNTVIANSGTLTLSGMYDISTLPAEALDATHVDVNGNTGDNGFSRDAGSTVQMVQNENTDAKALLGDGFGVFIGTREGTLDGVSGIATFGAGVNYATYTIVSGDDHKASAILTASQDAQGNAQLQQIEMTAGTLAADQSVAVNASATANDNGEITAKPTINLSGDDTELSGTIADSTLNASGGTLSAALSGNTDVTVTGAVEISGDNSHAGNTTISGENAKLTVGSETALGQSEVHLKDHGALDLNDMAVENDIYVEGCTLAGADKYAGILRVSGELELADAAAASRVFIEGGSIKGASLRTSHLEVSAAGNGSVASDVTINDNGAIVLNNGVQLNITGSLTMGIGVGIALVGDEYQVGSTLITWTGTLTGDISKLTLDANGDYILAQDGKAIVLAAVEEEEPGEDTPEDDTPIVDDDTDDDTPIVDDEEEDDTPIVDDDTEDDKPIVGPEEPEKPAPVFDQASADLLVQSNWGAVTTSRAFANAVQGQRNNAGCIAEGRGTAWVAALGGDHDIESSGKASGSDITYFGAAAGVDMRIGKRHSVGVAFGYTDGEVSPSGLSDVDQESSYASIYGEHGLKKFANNSYLSLGWVAGVGRTESDLGSISWEQDSVQVNTRVAWNKKVTDRFAYNVFGGLEYFASESDTVAGCKSGSVQNVRGELGMGVRYVALSGTKAVEDEKCAEITPACERVVLYGELSYINDMVRNNPVAEINGLRGTGANPGRQGVGIDLGATIRIGERWTTNANYSFNAMDDSNEHSVNVGAAYTF